MIFFIGALKIIFVLGFLITIHECGHFFMAKACKVKVREFAIGFGPKIFNYKGKETKYTLRLIHLGGYVDMLGENERKDEPGSFSSSSIWKRILIVIAGATVNIVFGVIVYFSWVAIDFSQVSTIVDSVSGEYSQNIDVLKENDEIISINGKSIHLKSDLDEALENAKNENANVIVKRDGKKENLNVKLTKITTKYIGVYYSNQEDGYKEIKYVQENSPAEKAGLKKGDILKKVNDLEISNLETISDETNDIIFTIERNGKEEYIKVVAENVPKYIFGVILKKADGSFSNRMYYGFWQTISYLKEIGKSLINMFSGNVKVDQMMGPIGISEAIVKTKGIFEYIYLLSIISLSLGVSNLLPIPALDGGRLVLLIIEAIRRKPLNQEFEIKIQLLGFSFLILLSFYIAFNDIVRIGK